MNKKLVFITGNQQKVDWFQKFTSYPIIHKKIDLDEIQSLNTEEIVIHKVRQGYKKLKQPVLVEDTALRYNALGKLPGPLIKWFMKEMNNEELCKLLNGYKDRSAVAEVVYGLYDGKTFKIFGAEVEGTIADKPLGTNGMGWDPIFIPRGQKKTWGEMTDEEITKTSARRKAVEKLQAYLDKL